MITVLTRRLPTRAAALLAVAMLIAAAMTAALAYSLPTRHAVSDNGVIHGNGTLAENGVIHGNGTLADGGVIHANHNGYQTLDEGGTLRQLQAIR
jgi:hypothetical protein